MAIALLIYLHLIEVLAILHRLGWYRLDVDYTLEQCRNVALVLLVPVFVVPASLVKKDQLQEMKEDPYNYHKARRGGWMLVLYLIISIILVIKLVIG